MNREYMRKITTSFFIFIFLINSVPLTAWGAIAENVVESSVENNEKLELGLELEPDLNSEEDDSQEEIYESKKESFVESEDFNEELDSEKVNEEYDEIVETVEEKKLVEDDKIDDAEEVEEPLESEADNDESIKDNVEEIVKSGESENLEESSQGENGDEKYDDEVKYLGNEDGSVSFEVKKEQIKEKGSVSFEYKNSGFKVIFSEIEKDGILTIKEIKLSEEEFDKLNAVSDIAYDVTLIDKDGEELENGTFKYDLIFPLSKDVQEENSKIEVKYAENLETLIEEKDSHKTDENKTKEEDEKVIVEDLDHFTIFVATKTDSSSIFSGKIVINEVLVHSSDNNKEWVEIYNASENGIWLTDWTIDDLNVNNIAKKLVDDNAVNNGDFIPSGGFYVFEFHPGSFATGWLNNGGPETISIFDIEGKLVDEFEIQASSGSQIDNYPLEDQTVGRIKDGGSELALFDDNKAILNPVTKGFSNVPTGKIIFTSYICSDAVVIDNSYKPKSDGSGVDGGDLNECTLAGGYNIGHGDNAKSLPIPEHGVPVGKTVGGILEVDVKARNDKYVFGQLDENNKWIGYGDDKVYSDEVLGFACTNSASDGSRDNNAEAFVVKAGETTYCNFYASKSVVTPDIPKFIGFNEEGSSNVGDIPTHYNCGVAVNGDKRTSGTWEDVSASGTNVRYIRHNIRPNGVNDILLGGGGNINLNNTNESDDPTVLSKLKQTYPNNNTGSWGNFGANEGLYKTRVMAFSDLDNDGQFDVNEPISGWSDYCEITYDATAPDVFNVSLPDGSVTNGDSITQEWGSKSDDVAYYVYESYNDKDGTDLRWTKEFNTTSKVATNVGEAEYWWRVKAVDYAGNESEWSDLWKITVDNTVPTTPVLEGFLNPDLSCNSVTNSGTITVNWTDSDGTGSDIVQYEYQINYPKPDGTRGIWNTFKTVSELTGSLNEGVHYIRVRAQDAAGNWSDWSSDWIDPSNLTQDEKDLNCSIALDTTSPEIVLENPVVGDVIKGDIDLKAICNEECDYVNFWWRKEDQSYSNVSPDRRYHYEYDNGTDFEWTLDSLNAERSGGDSSYIMEDGEYCFYAAGKDLFGNWAKSEEICVTIDNTVPVIQVDNPILTNNRSPELTGTVDDPNAIVEVTIDGNTYIAVNNGDGTWILADDIISPELADGIYNVIAIATDEAGNVGTDATVDELVIDATAPILTEVISVNSPTNDNNPDYTFKSDEAGTITYGGSCSSLTSEAIIGDNTITFNSLPDGVYDNCTITVTDATGNVSNVLNVSEFIIDTEKPTASQLNDQIFNEGDSVPSLTVNGQDNLEISKFCFSVTEEINGKFIAETCSANGLGTSYDWNNISSELPSVFDTSMMPEGVYTVNYYVVDKVGTQSDNYSVKYTLNNVAPNLDFSVEDDDIDENDNALFNASFTDPSSIDAGDGLFDDSEWYAFINYGEGKDVNLGTFSNISAISIPDHEYKHDGDFVAKLTVCESNINLSSEKECTTKEISIEVDDIDENEDDEEIVATTTYSNPTNYYVNYNNTTSDEEVVEEVIEQDEEIKPVVKKVEKLEKEENKGIVAGEQTCKDNWPLWAWILIVIIFGSLASLIGNGTKTRDENYSSIFWQAMLMILTLIIWYFFDSCRSFIWVPILTVVAGAIIATIFYKGDETIQS